MQKNCLCKFLNEILSHLVYVESLQFLVSSSLLSFRFSWMSRMKRGILEVFLVDAHGITHTNFIGTPVYYVLLQCGTKEYRSKMSKGDNENALWNQKFVFDFPMSQWKKLTHIKFRIMDKELFKDGGFVGETIIHLGGIISEGRDRGYMEIKPAPYNVVLDDDTFKGELKLGLRFIATDKLQRKAWELKMEAKNREEPMISPIFNLMKLPLLRLIAAWARRKGVINAKLLYCFVDCKQCPYFLFVARNSRSTLSRYCNGHDTKLLMTLIFFTFNL